MTIRQAIEKSIEGGYRWKKGNQDLTPHIFDKYEGQNQSEIFLDHLFWQSLGKAMGWEFEDVGWPSGQDRYLHYWHRFIDHLAEGKDAESFFSNL